MISHVDIVVVVVNRSGVPVSAPSPQNSSGPRIRDDGFLAKLGNDRDFDLARVYVKDRIRWVSLRVDNLIFLIIRRGPSRVFLGEQSHHVKRTMLSRFWHDQRPIWG